MNVTITVVKFNTLPAFLRGNFFMTLDIRDNYLKNIFVIIFDK